MLFVFGGYGYLILCTLFRLKIFLFLYLLIGFLFRVCQYLGIAFKPFFLSPVSLYQRLLELARRIIICSLLCLQKGFHYHLLLHLYLTWQSVKRTQKSGAIPGSSTDTLIFLLVGNTCFDYLYSYCENRGINVDKFWKKIYKKVLKVNGIDKVFDRFRRRFCKNSSFNAF